MEELVFTGLNENLLCGVPYCLYTCIGTRNSKGIQSKYLYYRTYRWYSNPNCVTVIARGLRNIIIIIMKSD